MNRGLRTKMRASRWVLMALSASACQGTAITGVTEVAVDLTIALEAEGAGMPTGGAIETLEIEVAATASLHAIGINAIGLPFEASEATWESSNPAVAEVSADGVVTAVSAGTADVTATVDALSASVAVIVTEPEV